MATTPLIVIVGPTASGKTAVAIDIAKQVGGEIISADSRTIYRGMDIGTAKPSLAEQSGVTHWGIDISDLDDDFSAARFKAYAEHAIEVIRKRGNIPILVGGTGLYIDSIVFNYVFGPVSDPEKRAVLENMSIQQLHNYCIHNNILLPENSQNKRYVIRAIERHGHIPTRRLTPIDNTIIVGITTNKEVLRQRIQDRTRDMFEKGIVQEAKQLAQKFGRANTRLTANTYGVAYEYIDGKLTIREAIEKAAIFDWRLAKRQLTWLKRNQFIHWLPLEQVKAYVLASLANQAKA